VNDHRRLGMSIFRALRPDPFLTQSVGKSEGSMVSIQIMLNTKDLSSQMGKMRDWLDANRIEAAGFTYSDRSARLVFRETQDARTFLERFAFRT
jgi:hypothetical protein